MPEETLIAPRLGVRSNGTMTEFLKHLPGRHEQQLHAGPEKGGGGLGGVGDRFTPASLTGSRHVRREKIGETEVTRTLKTGETRTKTVPVFEFTWSDTGEVIRDPETIERLQKAAPPGVTKVIINPDPNGHIIAMWTDSKERIHARYSKSHAKGAAAEKFQRLKDFHQALPRLRRRIKRDLQSPKMRVRENAAVLYLIDKTGFRIGSTSDTKASVQAYGASTLLGRHVSVNGNKTTFDFVGKKGVRIRKTVTDSLLAQIVSEHKTSNWSQPLFKTDSGKVRNYLLSFGRGFKIKDFRTWNGTNQALKWVVKRKGPASTELIFRRWQNWVGDKVAKFLGNTRGVSLNAYIDPHVWMPWRKPEWGPWVPKTLKGED